jgi:hypothetical protein
MQKYATVLSIAAASAAIVTAAAPADAQRAGSDTPFAGAAPLFGAKGQVVISSDAALSFRKRNDDGTRFELVPAFDYFVSPNLSVGGFLRFVYDSAGDGHTAEFSLGPRVGYNILLSDIFSFWPKIGLSYAMTSTTNRVNNGQNVFVDQTSSSSGLALNIFAPFLLHPVPHFFVGFGPFIDAALGGDARSTEFGARLTLGGWL